MANNHFHFKQFTINQEGCGMKVCTDSCIFGSWLAEIFSRRTDAVQNCFDIGTGTGLLALLFAQKNSLTNIDAVEIDEIAAIRAKENFANSPWNSRLHVFNADIKEFSPGKKYDLVISNPPFYEKELISPHQNKNLARHHSGLLLNELITVAKNTIDKNGHFAILLPYYRVAYFEDLAAKHGLFSRYKLLISQSPKHDYFRGAIVFSADPSRLIEEELTISTMGGNYTNQFSGLLTDYYLKL